MKKFIFGLTIILYASMHSMDNKVIIARDLEALREHSPSTAIERSELPINVKDTFSCTKALLGTVAFTGLVLGPPMVVGLLLMSTANI